MKNDQKTKDAEDNDLENNSKKENPAEESTNEKLDPTHFGDWQIDGRAIDF